MRRTYWTGVAAAAILCSPALAADTSFTPDAAATWSARSMRMAKVVDLEFGESVTSNSFKIACDGLTGEQVKHEYGKEPRWALSSQLWICGAYDAWAKKFQGNKKPCGALKKGIEELDKGSQGANPPEVAAAAQSLRAAADMILSSAKSNKAC